MVETRKIPAAALRMVADVEVGDNGDNATTAPVKILARSGNPVMTPWFEYPVVHDFASMSHKPRIILDHMHDDYDSIGYLNKFDTSTGDLVVSGAIKSIESGDMAEKLMKRSRAGYPYEASIDWRGDCDFEELGANQSTMVNGRDIAGPAYIVRRWRLRAVAICPHGADPNTSAQFSDNDTITVSLVKFNPDQSTPNGDKQMSEETTPVEAEVKPEVVETVVDNDKKVETEAKPEVVETTETSVETQEVVVETQTTEVETSTVEVAQQTDVPDVQKESQPSEGERFLQVFGDKGGVYFAKGMTFESALLEHVKQLSQENAELKQRMQASRGAETPVSFSESPDAHSEQSGLQDAVNKMTAKGRNPAVAKLAAALELRQKRKTK